MFAALIASALVAMASLSARLVVWLQPDRLPRWLPWLQASAAGLLLGDALLGMLPEAISQHVPATQLGELLAIGVLCLFGIECLIRGAETQAGRAVFARVDIVGDALHHLVDGVAIGAGFALDPKFGAVIALAIIGHELPREMGHAGVLVAGGYPPRTAFNLSVATTLAIPCGALAFSVIKQPQAVGRAMAVATGIIVYLACADLIPNIWTSLDGARPRQVAAPVVGVVGGLIFMWLTMLLGHVG